jgi:nucleoside-diphosphate-sugar epimerase
MKTVLVLGALGGVGKAVAKAFVRHGWRVFGLVRPGKAGLPDGVEAVTAGLFDARAVARATGPVDVVFNGLNLPYPVWPTDALPLFTAAADVAEAVGARQIYPGSVYNFGAGMPKDLTPDTAFAPTTVKGRIRVAIEALFRDRAEAGRLRTIVLRAGDFFGEGAPQSWMHALVAKEMRQGKITVPGPFDVVHAWAFLPDMAETVVRLAEVEQALGAYEVFHFDSHNMTARQLRDAAQKAAGRQMSLNRMPRLVFPLMGLFDPMMKATIEMLYLWDVPHALKDGRLPGIIGPLPHTPLVEALKTLP